MAEARASRSLYALAARLGGAGDAILESLPITRMQSDWTASRDLALDAHDALVRRR